MRYVLSQKKKKIRRQTQLPLLSSILDFSSRRGILLFLLQSIAGGHPQARVLLDTAHPPGIAQAGHGASPWHCRPPELPRLDMTRPPALSIPQDCPLPPLSIPGPEPPRAGSAIPGPARLRGCAPAGHRQVAAAAAAPAPPQPPILRVLSSKHRHGPRSAPAASPSKHQHSQYQLDVRVLNYGICFSSPPREKNLKKKKTHRFFTEH